MRTLLGAPGITRMLLGTKGIATRSNYATSIVAPGILELNVLRSTLFWPAQPFAGISRHWHHFCGISAHAGLRSSLADACRRGAGASSGCVDEFASFTSLEQLCE